jgi:tRNA-dihydrouridine synthase B
VLAPAPLFVVQLAQFKLSNRVFVAPMAGVTDRPFRKLCKRLGAGYAVSEMAASNPRLWASEKTSRRLNHDGEAAPVAVQIAGGSVDLMVEATRFNIERGADVIDINMGCPAKKVCSMAAGSALLSDERLVAQMLSAVVAAAGVVPVTLKFRTGPNRAQRNALQIARIAEQAGVAMLTLHGRTRADQFNGVAEYDTIALVKSRCGIPVVANGDIDSALKARAVLDYTGADAVMIGRAAMGRPWIFREVAAFLESGTRIAPPTIGEVRALLLEHLADHYAFYGEWTGVRTGRKHIGWYVRELPHGEAFRAYMNTLDSCQLQLAAVDQFFGELGPQHAALPAGTTEERLAA